MRDWATRYRPKLFSEVLGQQHIITILKGIRSSNSQYSASYIFSGPYGSGKTTLARVWAKVMSCENITAELEPCNKCVVCMDIDADLSTHYTEIDAANESSKEDVQKVIESAQYLHSGPKKIFTFDESHKLSISAKTALLKSIEEDDITGEKRLVCMYCTTHVKSMPDALRSRCLEFKVLKPNENEIVHKLCNICNENNIEYSDEALRLIYKIKKGHPRSCFNTAYALSLAGPITEDSVRQYLRVYSIGIVEVMGNSNLDTVLEYVTLNLNSMSAESVYHSWLDEINDLIHANNLSNNIIEVYDLITRRTAFTDHSLICDIVKAHSLMHNKPLIQSQGVSQVIAPIINTEKSDNIVQADATVGQRRKLQEGPLAHLLPNKTSRPIQDNKPSLVLPVLSGLNLPDKDKPMSIPEFKEFYFNNKEG